MASKGKPSPRSAVKPLSDAQVAKLAREHTLVDPMRDFPTGPNRKANVAEINAQHPKGTKRLLTGVDVVFRASCKTRAWGLDNVPEDGPFITAASHVTMFDVFVPMASLFHMGRRPRYMAKAEMAKWPVIGKWFQLVGMQPVQRHAGKAKAIEETSVGILTSGRPLTVWPEGTVTRDPQKWVMSVKEGVGYIALEASRRLGREVPLFCAATWGAASINHWWPWPRKNVVMCYDRQLEYGDLLADMADWGEEPPADKVNELTDRVFRRLNVLMEEIRGERFPAEGYWDYRTMSRKPIDIHAAPNAGSAPEARSAPDDPPVGTPSRPANR